MNVRILLALTCYVSTTKCLQYKGNNNKMVESIEKYFPFEKSLFVVLLESDNDTFLPLFNVAVVVFTKDQVLQDCGKKLTDHDGYVFVTSKTATLEKHIVAIVKCLNLTTLKFKTKYILIIDYSTDYNSDHYEDYANVFYNLWKYFGIINIGILPLKDKCLTTGPYCVVSYNPFLAHHHVNRSDLEINPFSQDIRNIMDNRFLNMHGHGLRTAFYKDPVKSASVKSERKKHVLGDNPGMLFKQVLEETFNVTFFEYDTVNNTALLLKEIMGTAEFTVTFLPFSPEILTKVETISSGYTIDIVFVVPKPKQVESWRLFQYILTWQVCAGLGVVLFFLSGAALLFQLVHSNTNAQSYGSSGVSEVVSVWKAAWSVGVNKLPTTHSQRLLIACSLLLGLIFITLISVQLFALIKSKPRMKSIRTLQDLHDSNLPIDVIHKLLAPYLNAFENSSLRNLKDNLKTDKLYENVNYVDPKYLNITDHALVYTLRTLKLIMSQRQNQVFSQYFEVVEEPIYQAPLVLWMPPGSVYVERFKDVSLRLIGRGIFSKWFNALNNPKSDYYKTMSTPMKGASQELHQSDNQHMPLTYEDLTMAFYILYIGLTISTMCFFKELCKF